MRLGNMGDLSCLELAREPFLPLTDTPRSGFPAARFCKAPVDCSFDPRAEGAMTTARPPISLVLLVLLVLLHILSYLSLCQRTPGSARVVTL